MVDLVYHGKYLGLSLLNERAVPIFHFEKLLSKGCTHKNQFVCGTSNMVDLKCKIFGQESTQRNELKKICQKMTE